MNAKKIIVPVVIVAGIIVIAVAVILLGNAASKVSYADAVKIEQKSLADKISVNGTLESSEKKNVYARLNYQVEKINVSVGDRVKKGDVLCTIDTDELQQQILQQQATVDNSGVNSDYNLSEAEQRYADALADYQNGESSAVLNAAKALEQAEKNLDEARRQESAGTGTTLPSNLQNAENSLESARLTYENSVKTYEDAEKNLKPENYPADVKKIYTELKEAKERLNIVEKKHINKELEDAKRRLDDAEKEYMMTLYPGYISDTDAKKIETEYNNATANYETVKAKYDEVTIKELIKSLQPQYDSAVENLEKARDNAKTSMDNAKIAYDNARNNYNSVSKQGGNSEESYSVAVKNAEEALETAKNDYDIAVRQAESNLASLKKAAEQQRTVSGLNDPQVVMLQNLKDKLEYAVVTAPCDGIITAVNAEEGAVAAGALFTIEDIDTLKISAEVGEYDIPYIKEGMAATIKCDALGSEEFEGRITDVAKTPVAGSAYSTQSGTNYNIKVSINSDDERLLAGMNAKISIVTEEKAGALTITYDALTTDDKGNDAVYIAEKGADGVYRAKLVNVDVGLETDYEIEIISPEIKEGMYVLTNTGTLIDGATVMIDESEGQK